jgi:phosphoglycolate phosphatase-like HAD superfamily hydrolase
VLTGGAGGHAMSLAFQELFGVNDAFAGIPMAGRTDAWILADALEAHGVARDDPRVSAYRDVYLGHLERQLLRPQPGKRYGVMPGVRQLLDALTTRTDLHTALLTGNYERAAEMKLAHFNLWRYFAGGAFGDDAPDRNCLLARALDRVAAAGGPSFDAAAAVIVGDTPLDVAVAVAGGARSIGVATGGHAADALRDAGADVVFDDLSDTRAVIEALGR